MERECFEDTEVAGLLNNSFVSVKVDREERPDVDGVFMLVAQAVTGRGGWPLSVFLTPEGLPFFVATYIPKTTRHQMPGMLQLLPRISDLWRDNPELIKQEAKRIYRAIKASQKGMPPEDLASDLAERLVEELKGLFDNSYGGFGNTAKFPMAGNLLFLLKWFSEKRDSQVGGFLLKTLRAMALGGIRDHVGGGFHRYTVDRYWRVPHFEKMLYDQAMLLEVYSRAYKEFKDILYREIALEIVGFVEREFASEQGPFYTSLDADVDGKEGGYYLWRKDEIRRILPESLQDVFFEAFFITDEGNYLDESTGKRTGYNILYLTESYDIAKRAALKEALRILFDARIKNTAPLKDTKVLTDHNGFMISALCVAAKILEKSGLVEIAERAAMFFADEFSIKGSLFHCYYDGQGKVNGMLDDYAAMARAMLDLYEITGKADHLRQAQLLTEKTIELFYSEEKGTFSAFQPDPFLIDLEVEPYDAVVPSGCSIMMENLIRISEISSSSAFRRIAKRYVKALSSRLNRSPQQYVYAVKALLYEPLFP